MVHADDAELPAEHMHMHDPPDGPVNQVPCEHDHRTSAREETRRCHGPCARATAASHAALDTTGTPQGAWHGAGMQNTQHARPRLQGRQRLVGILLVGQAPHPQVGLEDVREVCQPTMLGDLGQLTILT